MPRGLFAKGSVVFFVENREQLRGLLLANAIATSCFRLATEEPFWRRPWTPRSPPSPFPSLSGSLSLSPVRDLTDTEHAAMAVVFRRR
jgi:hypothetical protein